MGTTKEEQQKQSQMDSEETEYEKPVHKVTMSWNLSNSSIKRKVQTNTVFPQKLNGNMQPVQVPQHVIISGMMIQSFLIMHGTLKTPTVLLIRLVRKSPIIGVCTTCMGMGSGLLAW